MVNGGSAGFTLAILIIAALVLEPFTGYRPAVLESAVFRVYFGAVLSLSWYLLERDSLGYTYTYTIPYGFLFT